MSREIVSEFPAGAYVYIHLKATNGLPFYVGKGSGDRAWDTQKRSGLWKRVAKKHGFLVQIVEAGLQEWAAFEIEIGLVAQIGRLDLGLGPLVNMTDGGEGMLGHSASAETRKKLSQTSSGKNNGMFGRKQEKHPSFGKKATFETRLKMSASRKAFQDANPNWRDSLGPITAEMRDKISKSRTGVRPSTDTREKLAEAQKQIWKDPCIRAARLKGIAQKGVKQDPEFAARRTAASHAKRRENELKLLAQMDCSIAAFCAPTKLDSLSLREEVGLGKG